MACFDGLAPGVVFVVGKNQAKPPKERSESKQAAKRCSQKNRIGRWENSVPFFHPVAMAMAMVVWKQAWQTAEATSGRIFIAHCVWRWSTGSRELLSHRFALISVSRRRAAKPFGLGSSLLSRAQEHQTQRPSSKGAWSVQFNSWTIVSVQWIVAKCLKNFLI